MACDLDELLIGGMKRLVNRDNLCFHSTGPLVEGWTDKVFIYPLRGFFSSIIRYNMLILFNSVSLRKSHTRSLEQRLQANVCEHCGKDGGFFEVHHVKKLKDVGKQGWERILMTRKRKTIVLCIECHDLLHAGQLSDRQ